MFYNVYTRRLVFKFGSLDARFLLQAFEACMLIVLANCLYVGLKQARLSLHDLLLKLLISTLQKLDTTDTFFIKKVTNTSIQHFTSDRIEK